MTHSYSALENKIHHRLRNDLNHAEEPHDVTSAFALAVRTLLEGVFGDKVRFFDEDICLTVDGYQLKEAITAAPLFKEACADSDLLAIIDRFAEGAVHRHKSLQEHADKIRARIHMEH